MKIDTRVLREHPLLAMVPAFTLRHLLSESSLSEYPKGTVIFREGDSCEAIYLIVSGRCESRCASHEGEDGVEIFGPSDVLGDRELLNHEAFRSTVTVVTDSVMLRIPGAQMRNLFERKPSFAGRFSQSVSQRLRLVRESKKEAPSRVRRVASFVSLSNGVEDRAVTQRLATALHSITGQHVLLVHLVAFHENIALKEWAAIESSFNGGFRFTEQLRRNEGGFDELSMQVTGDAREPALVAPLLSHLGRHFDYVLLHVGTHVPAPASVACMIQSDLTFIALQPTANNLYDFRLLIRQVSEKTRGDCSHIKPVLYLDEHFAATDFSNLLKQIGQPVHAFVRGFPLAGSTGAIDRPGNFSLHINSLAREIARCRIGLALSSGGAKGLAHIGVIQVLEENGIEIDMVAGSSMGAYVGAVWCFGHDGQGCEKVAREVENSRWGLLELLDPVIPPRQGFVKSDRVVRRLARAIGHSRFSDMVRPLRVVATDLDSLERVVFSTGEVAVAVAASIAIPGICVPVTIDGQTLTDGGIADPLPVDVLDEMGIERIIAVNTIPTPERMRMWLDAEREVRAQNPPRRGIGSFLNTHLNYFARGNVLDIMLRSIHGVQTRVAEASCREADVVLRPWACDARWHDFAHPGKYIALGRKTAEEQISELKSLVKPKVLHDPNLGKRRLAVAA